MQCACWWINNFLLAETVLVSPRADRSQRKQKDQRKWGSSFGAAGWLPLRPVKSIKHFCISVLGTVNPSVWLRRKVRPARLRLSLPVLHSAPQTSLSFICQKQPVIRIPLPAGPTHRKADVAHRGRRQTDVPAVAPHYTQCSPPLIELVTMTQLHTNNTCLCGLPLSSHQSRRRRDTDACCVLIKQQVLHIPTECLSFANGC